MSLHWTLIEILMYGQISIVAVLLIPGLSPVLWSQLFKSKFFKSIIIQTRKYFFLLVGVLAICFVDSVREIYNYQPTTENPHLHLDEEFLHKMKLFRAQRNFHITGFSLFLCFVIRFLATLISTQATLLAQNEASMKQAQNATQAAQNLLKEKEEFEKNSGDAAKAASNRQKEEMEEMQRKIQILAEKLLETRSERDRAKKDVESMKKQSENLTQEYDRLLKEHAKLQVASESPKKEE